MSRFHPLKVCEVRRETDDCVSICFAVPDELKEAFAFLPGQHLTLRKEIGGEDVRRNYSICSSPDEGELRIAVKKVPSGRFSTYANEDIREGDILEVMAPIGRFTRPIDPEQAHYYVAFAAGSGITPVMSLMKTILEKEPQSEFVLFYGNKRTDSVIFLEGIEALKNQYLGRLSVHYILSMEDPGNELFFGRIDAEKTRFFLEKLIDLPGVSDFFICGPEQMIHSVREVLKEKGVSESKVHFELFTTPAQEARKKTPLSRIPSEAIHSRIGVTLDGQTYYFDLKSSGETILDAASRSGADLPFACKGGVCCTCKAKLLEGEVEMEVNYGLVQEELDAGYILTCQAHPLSEKVTVSFDD